MNHKTNPPFSRILCSDNGRLSRRFFIATGVAAWAAWGRRTPADEPQSDRRAVQWKDEGIPYVDPKRLVVAMMGDPQIHMNPRSAEYARTAMSDLANLPHDFLVVLGDLVQNDPKFYDEYKSIILDTATRQVFSVAGNADLNCGLDEYQRRTGLPLYYSIYRRGIRFIFLSVVAVAGSTTHICCLGDEQLTWLRTQLAEDKEATTVICHHAPVFETTWHSEDRDAHPFPGSMYLRESTAMRELFRRYANIKLFVHGHLHHAYGVKDELGRGEYHQDDGVLHVSVGATANNRGSSFLYVEKDRIVMRVRDHARAEWKEQFEYSVRCKTTLRDI